MIEFDLDRLEEALRESKRKEGAQKTVEASAPTPPPASRPQAVEEVFTPETLEALLDRVQRQRRPWEAVLEGGERVRVYPTREWWERARGRGGDGAVEFYAAELRRALPMLKEGYARQLLALKRALGAEVVDWRPPATPEPPTQARPQAQPASRPQERLDAPPSRPAPTRTPTQGQAQAQPEPATVDPPPQLNAPPQNPWAVMLGRLSPVVERLEALGERGPLLLEVVADGVLVVQTAFHGSYRATLEKTLIWLCRKPRPERGELWAVWRGGRRELLLAEEARPGG